MSKMEYNDIRDDLKTGDVVLFDGRGWISRLIKLGTFSRWSHVGLVYVPRQGGTVFLYESTTLSNVKGAKGAPVKGVQTVDLWNRVRNYKGSIAIRRVNRDKFNYQEIIAFEKMRSKYRHKVYERSVAELIKSAFGRFGWNQKEDDSSLFCSELVAASLKALGVLSSAKSSNSYTPADFGNMSTQTLHNPVHIIPQ
jgi:hypothetical protein